MAEANELVLEVGRPGSQQLSTQLVRKTGLKHVLKGERPRFLLAYTARASVRAQTFRLRLLENLSKSKPMAATAATRMHVTVVYFSNVHWQKEVQTRLQSLQAADIFYFIGHGETTGVSVEAKGSKKLPLAVDEDLPSSDPPKAEDPLALARARRDRVLTLGRWYTAPEVAKLLNGAVAKSNPSQYASTLRRQRRLLGVLQKGEYLHPGFQFNEETGTLRREVTQLLRVLPKDATGWGAALWCFQPTGRLGGRRPADVFAAEAKAVIAAAKKDFQGDDGSW